MPIEQTVADAAAGGPAAAYPLARVRADFPALAQSVNGHPLTYLDSAATTLKPAAVVARLAEHYARESANIHRGVHHLSEQATHAYEAARGKVRDLINAGEAAEIVFTSGTTASINLVAQAFGPMALRAGDAILITHMEHHSNIVPWQMLRDRIGCRLCVAPIADSGELDMEAFERLLNPRTKLVAVVAASNSLGTINPVKRIVAAAHAVGARVLVDAAQAVACRPIDVRALDCDFLAFSGHKLFGPTGVGVLYGKREWLDAMPPFLGGGDMILRVTFEQSTYNKVPHKFEAGTPHIAGVIGLGAAIDYVRELGLEAIAAHERALEAEATERLRAIGGVRLFGTAPDKAAIVSFLIGDVHPHDVGSILDGRGIAVRAGHHCTQPVMQRFGVPATVRASFSIYNNRADVDRLIEGVAHVKELFG